jgi:hypothetical protein
MPLEIKIYKIIILPVVLCGREIWSLTLREGHRLRLESVVFWVVLPYSVVVG